MKFRAWYPQLDVYDAIRRMASIIARWSGDITTQDRLYVTDFYLANPPLLHHTHMPAQVRRAFNEVGVARPERAFLSYPSAPILYHQMEPVQREALQNLVGKGFIDLERLAAGKVAASQTARGFGLDLLSTYTTDEERRILGFLVGPFSTIGEGHPGGLRAATGLRRIGA
jgi:hypothetical protein